MYVTSVEYSILKKSAVAMGGGGGGGHSYTCVLYYVPADKPCVLKTPAQAEEWVS